MGFTLKTGFEKPGLSVGRNALASTLRLMRTAARRGAWLPQFALASLLLAGIALVDSRQALSDLRVAPVWFDQNPVGSLPDWHYRVPVTLPAGSVNSTAVIDVDFAALLAQLGISGTFDGNSPRVVRANGSLSTFQEFTDSVYGGATDAGGNARGEIRFLLEDAAPATYYLYFDITENGVKPANPQTPINANFERGATGQEDPTGWSGAKVNAAFDAQVRPGETPLVTSATFNPPPPLPQLTDGTPFSGSFSYLLGARTNDDPVTFTDPNNPATQLNRTFTVPATNPGNLTFRYRLEGWDSSDDNQNARWDIYRITLTGAATQELVGPSAASPNYVTYPFAPNKGTEQVNTSRSGYNHYNGWDTDLNGNHYAGMTIAKGAEPWFTRTVSLAAFAGQSVTLRFASNHTTSERSWMHVDDVEWSVVNASLGTPEGFGVNITAPNDTAVTTVSSYNFGDTLLLAAVVDADPAGAGNPVTADVINELGATVASGVRLYNDGTHGDAVAGDGSWTNDGSVPADPTYTFSGTDPTGSNWQVQVFAADGSTSTVGAPNGLVHIPGQPNTPVNAANFHNVDAQVFTLAGPDILLMKLMQTEYDPFNLTVNPKAIPGARIRYTINASNQGTGAADNNSVVITDNVPANTEFCVADPCAQGLDPVRFIDGPGANAPSGLAFSYATDVSYSSDPGPAYTYGYPPSADADGYDAAVTSVRIAPTGAFLAPSGGGNPGFNLELRVRVQ